MRADSSYCGQDVALFKKLGELLWPNPKVPRSSLSSLIFGHACQGTKLHWSR